ncbi:hypothetical protein EAE96_010090 [Botrytis aclada]|nr:hypothetical protein EAE96_010090 [Botrytis aclada]
MMNYQQDESIRDLNVALQRVLLAFPGNSGHQLIQETVRKAINASASESQFPTPACIQTEEESKHFDQLRNFIDNLVLTVTPQALPASSSTSSSSRPTSEHNKRKSLDDPDHDAKLSRRKLSKAEQEAAGALQELSAGV